MGLEKIKKVDILKTYQIKHHSYVDILGLLKIIPVWFNQLGYYFYEKGLSEKDIGTGDELLSEWIATKNVTEYIQFSCDITVWAKDLRKITMESGEEVYWGRVLIIINSALVKDFQNKFGAAWYEELMRQFYERFVVDGTIKKYLGKLTSESRDLIENLKQYLK